MCGRATLTYEELKDLETFLNATSTGELTSKLSGNAHLDGYEYANFNAPPTSVLPVCCIKEDGERFLKPMYWWFMKWKTKDGKPNFKYSMFNAHQDRLLESKVWKPAISDAFQRCIVPLSGYYEFMGPQGDKTPHYFYPTDQPYFAAAGLCSSISPFDGVGSFAIITTEPNEVQEPIHDRMPAFLRKEEFNDWLNPDHTTDYILDMIEPYPDDAMKTHVVSQDVNSTRNRINEPYLIEKAELF